MKKCLNWKQWLTRSLKIDATGNFLETPTASATNFTRKAPKKIKTGKVTNNQIN